MTRLLPQLVDRRRDQLVEQRDALQRRHVAQPALPTLIIRATGSYDGTLDVAQSPRATSEASCSTGTSSTGAIGRMAFRASSRSPVSSCDT